MQGDHFASLSHLRELHVEAELPQLRFCDSEGASDIDDSDNQYHLPVDLADLPPGLHTLKVCDTPVPVLQHEACAQPRCRTVQGCRILNTLHVEIPLANADQGDGGGEVGCAHVARGAIGSAALGSPRGGTVCASLC